jgi:phosphate transport system permease protein
VLVGLIVWKVIEGARLSISTFGLSFVWHTTWDPVHNVFGAGAFIFGTAVTSFGALILATPIALGIALFLTELAPRGIRGPVTSLVETLAAIPSVVIGLWGIFVLGPILRDHVSPALHSVLGFIPLFGPPGTYGSNVFTAIVVLTIMILPIIASISRELFLSVPTELKEGALGLGTTRWEMIRGVVFPYSRGGVAAAVILGFGRAIGEAIAVAQVIGAFTGISVNLFHPGNTLGANIALNAQGASSGLETSSLIYCALILLVFSIVVNLLAQWIVRRTARRQGLSR